MIRCNKKCSGKYIQYTKKLLLVCSSACQTELKQTRNEDELKIKRGCHTKSVKAVVEGSHQSLVEMTCVTNELEIWSGRVEAVIDG